MISLFKKSQRPPVLSDRLLKTYRFDFSLDRLVAGVDNVRCDVRLDPEIFNAVRAAAFRLVARETQTERLLCLDKNSTWSRERDELVRLCRNVLLSALNRAKSEHEVQIDFLARAAASKLFLEEARNQFELLLDRCQGLIRSREISQRSDPAEVIRLKESLAKVRQNRRTIIQKVSFELFRLMMEAQSGEIENLRQANFGEQYRVPDDVFANPVLHAGDCRDDFFMVEEYVLLGHRFEDPDRYEAVLSIVRNLLADLVTSELDHRGAQSPSSSPEEGDACGLVAREAYARQIDAWIMHEGNTDILFNCFESKNLQHLMRQEKGEDRKAVLAELKVKTEEQRQRLEYFYHTLKEKDLDRNVIAAYEMQPVHLDFCPPLVPRQVMQFLISPESRKEITSRLERLEGFYGKPFDLKPLRKTAKRLDRVSHHQKLRCLLRFYRDFSRYHRDLQSFQRLKKTMDRVNLAVDEKIVTLSRANGTLFELILSPQDAGESKPVINHVIVKADVRGSTEITRKMVEKGLNPASYFSLNLFNPITEILYEYGAEKVFIEGDAIILSIFERENMPQGWYGVARACGLAAHILQIVHRYNAQNQKHDLPILELGIGVSYQSGPPTFLFDGSSRIMISPAINMADRLSGCTRSLRKIIPNDRSPFNLHVFMTPALDNGDDEPSLRYNVNGIEVNEAGLEKLGQEIRLTRVETELPGFPGKKTRLHVGTFPTETGKFHQLVVREEPIPEVSATDLTVLRITSARYYEVCTHPAVLDLVKVNGVTV
jgi:class 3 adenylate cyclase